jgi:hypothetical protein
MSSEDSTVIAPDTDDLDAFSSTFFAPNKEKEAVDVTPEDTGDEEQVVSEEDNEPEADTLAPEDENQEETADEDEDEADEEPVEPQKPEKPKSRFQERIDQLNEKARKAEEAAQASDQRLADALARLEALEKTKTPEKETETPVQNGPSPDDKNEDGTDKYPLGDFDPAYIRDLTRYTFAAEVQRERAAEAEQQKQREAQEARDALKQEWEGRLDSAKEKYPDLNQKSEALFSTFTDLEPGYGDYLAATIMSLEYGPDVLYHLASNVAEAKKIVESGPARATIALGRLEARFALNEEDKRSQKMKVSQAPTPPARLNKGSMVSRDIAADTDDLDAFSKAFFKQKR